VPFIRHLRDKRGYETTIVMHGYRPQQQGPQRTRVLYLFRSPSHVKFGRRPLDEESREALEHTHPDISFDWNALGRESAAMRAEETRDRERERDRGGRQARHAAQPPRPAPPPPRVVVEDHSTLGRALGADQAARLRAAYVDLVQRVTRRARTPEERDRLIERAQRLNPDEWPDEATVRVMAGAVEADREAILAELPSRRRGRRGGRRRDRGEENGAPGETGPAAEADDSSEIMAEEGELDATAESDALARHDGPAGDRPVDGGAGTGNDERPAGDGLPVDDELRPDGRHRS
jgi:hypothetical protein